MFYIYRITNNINGMANKGSHSNKGQHWKLVDGRRVYYKSEESKIDENIC